MNTEISASASSTRSVVTHVMMQDLVGDYDDPSSVPEWQWVVDNASYAHTEVWEYVVNLATTLTEIPQKLVSTIEDARSQEVSYIIFHQGV